MEVQYETDLHDVGLFFSWADLSCMLLRQYYIDLQINRRKLSGYGIQA